MVEAENVTPHKEQKAKALIDAVTTALDDGIKHFDGNGRELHTPLEVIETLLVEGRVTIKAPGGVVALCESFSNGDELFEASVETFVETSDTRSDSSSASPSSSSIVRSMFGKFLCRVGIHRYWSESFLNMRCVRCGVLDSFFRGR